MTSVTDTSAVTTGSAGKVTTTTDLLGRGIGYTDVWGTTTTTSYDRTGRITKSVVKQGTYTATQEFAYDVDSRLAVVKDNGQEMARVSYVNTNGALDSGTISGITYPAAGAGNGTSLGGIARNAAGAQTAMTWSFASGAAVTDTVVRSQSGRIVQDALADGSAVSSSSYQFDAAGRLVKATIPNHVLTYSFAPAAASCPAGAASSAFKNGNRSGMSDVRTVGGVSNVSLPGGVLATIPVSGAESWSYPNLHGDVVVTADGSGARAKNASGVVIPVAVYDPFGQVVDPVSKRIGSKTADDAGLNTQTGTDVDYGWLGQHQKLFEHFDSVATIEMGARQYVPALGRRSRLR